MKLNNADFLTKLCKINGVSGYEDKVRNLILEEIKDYVDEYKVDALGNLIALKKGPSNAKKMMLSGHMDQIGLMATYISDEGFIYFTTIGGKTPNICLGQRFVFENGTVGVVATERIEEGKELKFDKMYIDIGAENKEEALKYVQIGSVCNYDAASVVTETAVISPALDDRIGCFIMIEALKKLKNQVFDIYFTFSVQEEVGLRGAKTAAFGIEPDYAIAFDVTGSFDTPKAHKMPSKMFKGAAIKIKDRSVLCHPTMIAHLEECAKSSGIKYQFDILAFGGTDAGTIHLSRGGVITGGISIASRYIHTANEMVSVEDIASCIDLTVAAMETEVK